MSVRFTVSPQGGTGTYSYAWTFGDGQSSTQASPTHVYSAASDYTPSVQVTSGGDRVTCSTSVSVTTTPPPMFSLNVSRQGPGSGVVTSNPAGIDCGNTCSADYPQGTPVSLTASPDGLSTFTGWSGACSGTGACTVTMDAARSVSARFDRRNFTLNVSKTPIGNILGSVTSSPGGINCGLLCANASATFQAGTVVTLTAQAAILAGFDGWRGDCSGSGACVLTMDANKTVVADFSLLGLGSSRALPGRAPGLGDEIDLGVLRSSLKLGGARGEIMVNGRTLLLTSEGESQAALTVRPGQNLIEAWVRESSGAGGGWRFELVQSALPPGALGVIAGDAVAVTPDSVTFRLRGKPGERVSFVLRVPGGRESPP